MSRDATGRRDRLIQEKRHDVYPTSEKLPEPTRCTGCGVVYSKGRWVRTELSGQVHETVCPACRRVADDNPAGFVEIRGAFFGEHRDEVENLLRNLEAQESGEHPLERIMAVSDNAEGTLVTTTGVHLARRIGEALHRAYQGELSFRYADDEKLIRLTWER